MTTRRVLIAGALSACVTEPAMPHDTIYEFRDYTLRPGQRDTLIALFEREFIEPQEALGAHVRATFRDLDEPDRFVWMRSFADAQSRYAALDGFYTGPVWQAHRGAANATMIDSDNVLQLRPVSGALGVAVHAPPGATAVADTMVLATIYYLREGADSAFAAFFESEIAPALRDIGAAPFATFATERTPNAYPRLPIRENETVFLTLTRFASPEAYANHLADTEPAQARVAALLQPHLIAPIETRRLQPTARSPLR
jgi:quinol monooxygenase YgiN